MEGQTEKGYWQKITEQRVNRRRVIAATGSTAIAAALLAACGGDDEEDGSSRNTSTGATTSASSGTGSASGSTGTSGSSSSSEGDPVVDKVVIGVEYSGEETLDFMVGGGGAQSWLYRPHMETLLAKDRETNEPIARLAEEWKVSDDGTEIYFKLRPGVKFHGDWGEVTAEDVVWNYDVHKRMQEPPSSAARSIKEVQVLSPTELNFVLTRPDATVLDLIFTDQYSTSGLISKKHFESVGNQTELSGEMLASTGPWHLSEWAAGTHIIFDRVEDHWRQTPAFKQLEYRIINETSTRLSALLAGEIHATTLPWDLHGTAVERGMQVLTGPVPAFHVWMEFFGAGARDPQTGEFRHPDSPLLDLRVRKALNKAIDRNALNEAFLGGQAEVAILNHMHPSREGWDESWQERWEDEYGYDPDAARELLAEAGYGPDNPLHTTVLVSYQTGFPEGPDVQETIIAYWKEVGVEATLETVDRATEREIAERFEYDNHFWMGTTLSATGVDGYRIRQINDPASLEADPDFKGNFRGINLPELEEVILKTIQAPNAEQFDKLSREMGELAFVNHVTVPLFWLPTKILVDPKVIQSWEFSGGLVGLWSHTEYIEPVRA